MFPYLGWVSMSCAHKPSTFEITDQEVTARLILWLLSLNMFFFSIWGGGLVDSYFCASHSDDPMLDRHHACFASIFCSYALRVRREVASECAARK